MAGATMWKGYIHFKDIDVAVKLHSAVREERIGFHLLHANDQVRLRQQMVCAYEKQPVPGEEQVKGFEVEDGKYIIVDPEELEQLVPDGSRPAAAHFVTAFSDHRRALTGAESCRALPALFWRTGDSSCG
jgi:DNA end-binding protein Ku